MRKKKKNIDRAKKLTLFLYFYISTDTGQAFLFLFCRTNWLYHTHGAVNFWAELDLNQRRHVANEFTVRPH